MLARPYPYPPPPISRLCCRAPKRKKPKVHALWEGLSERARQAVVAVEGLFDPEVTPQVGRACRAGTYLTRNFATLGLSPAPHLASLPPCLLSDPGLPAQRPRKVAQRIALCSAAATCCCSGPAQRPPALARHCPSARLFPSVALASGAALKHEAALAPVAACSERAARPALSPCAPAAQEAAHCPDDFHALRGRAAGPGHPQVGGPVWLGRELGRPCSWAHWIRWLGRARGRCQAWHRSRLPPGHQARPYV